MLPEQRWARLLVLSAYILLAALVVFLFMGKLISLFLPFAFAFAVGYMLRSPTEKLHRRLGIPRKLVGLILVSVVIFFIGFVVFLLANQLVSEAQRLFERLSQSSGKILSDTAKLLDRLAEKFPFIYEHLDRDVINGSLTEVLKNFISSLSASLAQLLTAFVTGLPDIGLFFVVFVIASFYFAMDLEGITSTVSALIPHRMKQWLKKGADRLKSSAIAYIKAYSVILLITFAQLFVGFLILRVNYATTLALIIALLDMLPVIGTGTVLIPWGIGAIVTGRVGMGIGILVMFGIITVVREVIEPKIVGSSIGMHPLLTLVAMYTGYKLLGLWGILIFPPALDLAKTLLIDYTPKTNI